MHRCKSRLCMFVCAWLWISGLVLMGKILHNLEASNSGLISQVTHMDVVGSLQILFLFYTITCLALYFLWQKVVELNGKTKTTHSTA